MKKAILLTAVSVLALSAVLLGGCSPKTVDANEASEPEGQPVAQTGAWSKDSDCGSCHESQSDMTASAEGVAAKHLQAGNAQCITCHADAAALEEAHDGATGPAKVRKLKKTEVSEGTCLSCHNLKELTQQTASYTALVDEKGTQVNPHELPEVEEHQSVTCGSCHTGHKDNVSNDTLNACWNCHHAKVFECNTCHEA